jgi:hypothetical protein
MCYWWFYFSSFGRFKYVLSTYKFYVHRQEISLKQNVLNAMQLSAMLPNTANESMCQESISPTVNCTAHESKHLLQASNELNW